ncbi:MAG TPA: hypothetical protein VMT97_18385 [Terriglobales bacterium]|nr:hypothetical protein [Terriglobales bacterium]
MKLSPEEPADWDSNRTLNRRYVLLEARPRLLPAIDDPERLVVTTPRSAVLIRAQSSMDW